MSLSVSVCLHRVLQYSVCVSVAWWEYWVCFQCYVFSVWLQYSVYSVCLRYCVYFICSTACTVCVFAVLCVSLSLSVFFPCSVSSGCRHTHQTPPLLLPRRENKQASIALRKGMGKYVPFLFAPPAMWQCDQSCHGAACCVSAALLHNHILSSSSNSAPLSTSLAHL